MANRDGRAFKNKNEGHTEPQRNSNAHAQQMTEFRARAEQISRNLEGRKHSDSADLLREDRAR
jgi:hypothetical protein